MQYLELKKEAAKKGSVEKDVELIEQTAIEADSELYQFIIKNVTEGIPWEYMEVPCGRRQFYEARRTFFVLLSKKR